MPPIFINGQEVVKRYVGIQEVVAAYVGSQQVFSGAAALIQAPADQTIFTTGVANTITASFSTTIFADSVSIGTAAPSLSWTPGSVDYDVDLQSNLSGPVTKVAVAAANGMNQTITGWTKTGVTVSAGATDEVGGTSAYLVTCSAGAGNHMINSSPSPVMVNNETGWEVLLKAGTISKFAFYDTNVDNKIAYIDIATGESQCSKLACKIVQDYGNGWKRLWLRSMDDIVGQTKLNTMRIYAVSAFGSLSFTATGAETFYVRRPRSIDGPLPLRPYQKSGIRRNGSTAYGAERWTLTTPHNRNIADMAQTSAVHIDVLLPASYTTSKTYRVVHLMPVESVPASYADELSVINSLGLHNSLDCIFVRPTFYQCRTWGGIKSDGTYDHEAFISSLMVGLVDEFYSTVGTAESRSIVGYSAGGFAALIQANRNPDIWGYCLAWDVPLTAAYAALDQSQHFGSEAQYNAFNPYTHFETANWATKAKLVFGGSYTFDSDANLMFAKLQSELGNPINNGGGDYATTVTDPNGKWWKLYKNPESAHNFIPGWVTPGMAALGVLWNM